MFHLISLCISIDKKVNGALYWSSRLHFKGVYRGIRIKEVQGLCFSQQLEPLVIGSFYHLVLKEENILTGSNILQAKIIDKIEIDVSLQNWY